MPTLGLDIDPDTRRHESMTTKILRCVGPVMASQNRYRLPVQLFGPVKATKTGGQSFLHCAAGRLNCRILVWTPKPGQVQLWKCLMDWHVEIENSPIEPGGSACKKRDILQPQHCIVICITWLGGSIMSIFHTTWEDDSKGPTWLPRGPGLDHWGGLHQDVVNINCWEVLSSELLATVLQN